MHVIWNVMFFLYSCGRREPRKQKGISEVKKCLNGGPISLCQPVIFHAMVNVYSVCLPWHEIHWACARKKVRNEGMDSLVSRRKKTGGRVLGYLDTQWQTVEGGNHDTKSQGYGLKMHNIKKTPSHLDAKPQNSIKENCAIFSDICAKVPGAERVAQMWKRLLCKHRGLN